MVKITELKSFVMEELYTINKHFTDLSSKIDSGKCHKEIATLREDCASKNYIIKILVGCLSKYTNSFYKVNQKNCNPSYTDVNSQNDQPFVSPKKSIKINNKNTNRAIDVTRNNFVSPSRFSVFNCDEVSNNVLDDEISISSALKTRHRDTTRPITERSTKSAPTSCSGK